MTKMNDLETKLASDEVLAAKFKEALEAAKEKEKGDVEAICIAAAAVGFDVAPEEADKVLAGVVQLSEDDLATVSGGWEKGSDGRALSCAVSWHCHMTMLHTDTDEKNCDCWEDYVCMSLFHEDQR